MGQELPALVLLPLPVVAVLHQGPQEQPANGQPEVLAQAEVHGQLEAGVDDDHEVADAGEVVAHVEEGDVAQADVDRKQAGQVEEAVDAQDDAGVHNFHVLVHGEGQQHFLRKKKKALD